MIQSSAESRPLVTFERGYMVRIRGLSAPQKAELAKRLTIKNPKIGQIECFSGWVPASVPRFLYGYIASDDDFLIAPGYAGEAWRYVIDSGSTPELAPSIAPAVPTPITYTGDPRDYQTLCVAKASARHHGMIVAPCGSGKTDMALMLIAACSMRTLVLVHTKELMKQWVERVAARTNVTAVTFGGGKKTALFGNEPIIVATVQSLRRCPAVMQLMAETRDLVFTDECHHAPAATFTELLAVLPCRRRYGVTATPERADGLSELMNWWIGPILAEVGRDQLEADGHVMRPDLYLYTTLFRSSYDPDEPGDYSRLMASLVEDEERFRAITNRIILSAQYDEGRIHLVLSGSVAYGEKIARQVASMGVPTALLHGELGKKEREAEFARARERGIRVVVATTLADEGLDMPELTDVWLVTPSRSATKTEQRVGRVCRPATGKPTPRIHDFVDVGVERDVWHEGAQRYIKSRVFVNQFKERFHKVYRQIAKYNEDEVRAIMKGGGAQ